MEGCWIIFLLISIATCLKGVDGLDLMYNSSSVGLCVHTILDATLTLNLQNEQKTRDVPLTSARVTAGSCKESSSELHLVLQGSNSLNINFAKANDGTVSVSYKVMHERQDKTSIILESEPMSLSGADEVYKCSVIDAVLLHDDSGQNFGTLFISNATIQGFGIQNGTFSEKVKTCLIDNSNSTMQPQTLNQNEDVTGKIKQFELRDASGNVCIRLSGTLQLLSLYEKKDGNMTSVTLAVPNTAVVSGFCVKEKSYLVLRYKEGGSIRALAFYFSNKENRTTLENIETIIKLDTAKFPDAKLANDVLRSYGRIGVHLGSESSFYGCQHEKEFLGNDFILKTRHLKVQTSNTGVPEKFSAARTGCPEDNVRMTETQLFSLKDGNQSCLLLSGAFRMSIPYDSRENKTERQLVNVPFSTSIDVSGNCSSKKKQDMTLSFYDNWHLKFVFESTSSSGATPDSAILGYKLSKISMTYFRSPLIFYNPKEKSTGQTVSVSSKSFETPLKARARGSYKCDDTIKVTLTDGVILEAGNLRFQAFQKSNSENFSRDVSTCNSPAKEEKRYAVYIIIGLAIVAVFALIVIVFVVSSKAKQRNYEKMN
ncbi:uncharacterized protein LOC133192500 [Saccostrea echinata]|uniref:uncharacterized protein LOC133192500 n=1 Tax=Saccostrea echinata TaxID=191078 RepID=UPI002A828E14|nr:uncharacterized protein LOC133192500 [Saccostrea echinata]